MIHDLAYPDDSSVNVHTDCSDIVAREITRCRRVDHVVERMAGDVASAYRNACTHSKCVYMFAGHISVDDIIIIDISAAFGWTGSTGTYSILDGAVAHTWEQL